MSLFTKHTSFKAGGLLEWSGMCATPTMDDFLKPHPNWEPKLPIDKRHLCMPQEHEDDQGQNPYCMAFGMINALQLESIRDLREPFVGDAVQLYMEAKRVDGNNKPGSYIESGIQAAKNLGLIDPNRKALYVAFRHIPAALTKYGYVLTGFRITEGWNHCDRRTGFIGDQTGELGGHLVLTTYMDYRSLAGPNWWGLQWGWNGCWRATHKQAEEQYMYGMVMV